jgi:N-acetyl-beta-hexosaminidase
MKGFARRAVMLDPARLMEKKAYYRGLLPWLREWGYNTLHFHLTDDQGSALAFPSHPELAKDGAFTADEMREFVKAASKLGISVIPEIESLGHTRCITGRREYRKLGAAPESGFNSLDPDNEDAAGC